MSPAAGARRLVALLASESARVEVLGGAGHGVFRQAPREVAAWRGAGGRI